MSTENALLTLLREGVSVQESSVDSKRDLEDALRGACNDFIEHTCTFLAKSILAWIAQCKACKSDLKNQVCMSAESVQSIVAQTADSAEEKWTEVTNQMTLYLESPATRSILLKPVSRKVSRLLEEARNFVGQAVDGENGWDATIRAHVLQQMSDIEHAVKKVTTKK